MDTTSCPSVRDSSASHPPDAVHWSSGTSCIRSRTGSGNRRSNAATWCGSNPRPPITSRGRAGATGIHRASSSTGSAPSSAAARPAGTGRRCSVPS
ncbi:hypothetical protein [Saccharopolyspora sp. 6V]|uniref:hypothetical protein n=1 Tax=Saccharopolyspora sp. 6V TaxID=2877239 RepID=UPI001CD32F29|nr:hypothetical protein [Saccharopolyspora sp. 6V]MCA1191292.1 hypothetical protein [Saccharopolyspora sp. 6V]